MSTAPASPPVLSTAPAPGSTDPPGLQDIWNSEIDLAIMQFLYQAKTQRNGTRDTFSAAVWTSLGKHLMENGHHLCTNEDLKDRFRVLKQRGYLLSPTGVIVPAAPSPAAPAATVPDRAQWTSEAEAISIEFFIAKKAQGLMSENNFKGKVYNLAAEHLCAKGHSFSGKQVKARWTRFKAEFKIVAKLRTLSGFGWDNARSMVIATDQVWDAYLVSHPKARPFRTHPFIHYDDIAAMVGHSTATGAMALSSENAVAAQKAPDTSSSSDDDDEDSDSDAADSEKESPVKKRRAAGPTPAPKRVRTSAGAQALTSMSSTFAALTEGLKSGEFLTSPSTDSPVKKKKAFDIVRAEEGLSPHSLAKARRVFRGSGEVAREYLSFDSTKDEERSARTFWLMDEMDRV
ncbi:hypothetical protein D9758_016204 [Tetrapyrgos nigripes]|uniref:Myb/SANT-like domain-containing protein n=1 Tax=Tetrapyrgos nigripes TaxID=182062 RepID=A0A8H5CMX2_9AGAR|nr:hypothetical protein D9758_016204 [Tetrapyrgos nigripes]